MSSQWKIGNLLKGIAVSKQKKISAVAVGQDHRLDLAVQVGRDDVVAVAVAQQEERLHAKIAEQKKNSLAIKKQMAEAIEVKHKLVENFRASVEERVAAAIGKMFETLEYKRDKDGEYRISHFSVPDSDDKHQFTNAQVAGIGFNIPTPDAIIAAGKTVQGYASQYEASEETLAELHVELANLSRFERKAKAKLAVHALQKTEEGRALLMEMERPLLGDGSSNR